MKRRSLELCAVAVATLTLLSCGQTHPERSYNEGINIIPTPNQIEIIDDEHFVLDKTTTISAEGEEARKIAEFVFGQISQATGFSNRLVMCDGDISLSIDSEMKSKEEGYTLKVSASSVEIKGKDAAGLYYGLQSFQQLLPAEITSPERVRGVVWSAPAVRVEDAPRFGYRGIMFDPCRHFVPVEFVKKQLDIMAMFKINRMHWHLTEDQGWRVEIKRYPLLTEVGSRRIENEGHEHKGYYTQEEIRDVVAYAAERHITIIPEFELPGHELAAIAAYPHLSCRGEQTSPRVIWGVEDIVMCPAKESTFEFIEDVIDEMCDLFPGEFFHIGGDECPKHSWESCPACQAFIRKHNLLAKDGHSAEERLQSYVIHQAEKMLTARGKRLIGWDEILEGGLSESATVMSWRGEKGGITAAKMGRNVIMSPQSEGMYINFFQGDNMIEPVTIGGDVPLSKTYAYDPIPEEVATLGLGELVMGVQANLWSEYMYTPELVEYQMYPRALALAEVGWSELERKDIDDFTRRVNNAFVRLDGYDVNYYIPQPEQPLGSTNFVAFTDHATLEFKTTFPVKMIYTTNGEEPSSHSNQYTTPITFTQDTELKIRSILPSGKMSPTRHITIEKQSYSPAVEVAGAINGLKMSTINGLYLNNQELSNSTTKATVSYIEKIEDVVLRESMRSSLRETKQVANIAEGYLEIPEDGVYHLWTNHNSLYIDGELLIDNDGEVKRFSRKSRSIALAKGLHPIRVVWLGNIIGGWPSNWDKGFVNIRKEGDQKSRPIKAEELFYVK